MSTNLSSRIRDFIKAEAVLVIAAVAAVASMAAFPLTPATLSTYIGYIDMRTIGLLFCLITVVAGLGRAGLLNAIRDWLMTRVGSARTLAFILINVVFIAAMLVTNDVALITFVPLALALFMQASPSATIATVVAITVAANLGSMCTPIGNPQNIFLVSAFSMDLGAFFATVLPVGRSATYAASLSPCWFQTSILKTWIAEKHLPCTHGFSRSTLRSLHFASHALATLSHGSSVAPPSPPRASSLIGASLWA